MEINSRGWGGGGTEEVWRIYNPIALNTLPRFNTLMFPQLLGVSDTIRSWSRNEIFSLHLCQKRMGDSLVANGVEGRIRGLDGRYKTCKVSHSAP